MTRVAALGWLASVAVAAAAVATAPAGFRPGLVAAAMALLAVGTGESIPGRGWARARGAIGLLAPVVVLAALYHPALAGSWMGDDPAILAAVAGRGVAAHLVEPAAWQAFSVANFTPWVIVSFGFDWWLAGTRAAVAYAHQWVSLAVVLLLAHAALRRWLGAAGATAALCLFVASVPVATAAQWLMTRHYVEGLGFALGAVLLYRRGVAGSRPASWAAAAAYLLGAAAKEVVVPLVVVLPFLVEGAWRTRRRALAPTLAAAGVYAAWRVAMLGPRGVLRGYGTLFAPAPGAGAAWPGIERSLGSGGLALAVAGVLLAVFAADAARRRAGTELAAAAVTAIATIAPLVPVRAMLQPRMVLVTSFCLAAGATAGLLALARGRSGTALAVGGIVLVALALDGTSRCDSWRDRTFVTRYRLEGERLLGGPPDTALLDPLGPPWYVAGLGTLRRELGGGAAPRVCYDPCLCAAAQTPVAAVRFAAGAMAPAVLDRAGCRLEAEPMRVTLAYDPASYLASWDLAPADAGSWTAVDPDGFATPVPAAGSYPLRLTGPTALRFAYRTPGGGIAASPPLVLDPTAAGADGVVRVSWSRGAPGG